MRIKRVVIQGFKTFATKTEFVFSPGITAVVGPNGSGKSNIVDAIRWCLGEQSFSLLRSKKTADIIFSGSDKRSRLGMAEVSLTLDNSNGEIPIDFEEVVISRRAYRDGSNEYLLNGQRVRLLDITELLAQTGLGKRTYALIGQGLIDKVLSLAPEDRRALFEEAAGITAYQLKRGATLRRLDATSQNLTRVQDIIAELSPRLKYLRRQADRANERKQIANDLRDMLRIWYGYRWHAAINKLDQLRAEEKQLHASMAERQAALTRLTAQIDALRSRQSELREKLGAQHHASSDLHRQAEATGRELAVARERMRQIQARQEEARRELAPLRLQQETLEARLAETEQTLLTAQAEVTQRQTRVDAMQLDLARRQNERSQLATALDQARRRLDDAFRQQSESQARLQQTTERRAILHQEEENQRQAREVAANEAAQLAETLTEAEGKLSQNETQARALQREIEQLGSQIAALDEQGRAAEQARQDADRVVDRLQTRLDLLRRLREDGAGYASGVRAVLQASDQQSRRREQAQLDGILGTVASLVQTPAHLDKAIETALGGALQNVVTRSWSDAQAAIEFLKRSGAGRATFLPLDRLHTPPPIEAPDAPGILGNAAALVECDPQVTNAVQQLLGRVWIAEDLSSARRALDQRRGGPRPTVATLAGEIIRPGGAVTGGSDRNRRDDSILARERELREAPARLEQAQTEARTRATQANELSARREQLQSQIQAKQSALADLARSERQARQAVEDLRRRLDRAQQTADWQAGRLRETEAELARLAEQEMALQARLAALVREQQDGEEALAIAQREVESAGVDDLLSQLADLRAHAAEALGHLRSQRTLQENQSRGLQSVRDQIKAKEQRIQELEAEAEQLARRIQELDGLEDELGAKIGELRARIDPAEAELARLERQQAVQEEDERAYQAVLRREESAWNRVQLQRQRAEDAIEQLQNEIEHDLGLVTLEEHQDLAYQPPLPLDAFVEDLPTVETLPEGLGDEVKVMRARLSRVSNVNPDAPREYEEAASRHEFLITQSEDLEAAAADLRKIIRDLDQLMEVELARTFTAVAEQFEHFFKLLFNGGTAKLVLTEPDDLTNTGIEIIARPPGKRPQSLALLSGGERALAACALIFGILRVSPTPFCVLDEVDAALDEANVDRFRMTVEDELSADTQFIIVTHNRRTLEGANAIYGVTMGNDGVSKVISLKLEGDKMVQQDGQETRALEEIENLVQM
jgi:chromosome segregation protein